MFYIIGCSMPDKQTGNIRDGIYVIHSGFSTVIFNDTEYKKSELNKMYGCGFMDLADAEKYLVALREAFAPEFLTQSKQYGYPLSSYKFYLLRGKNTKQGFDLRQSEKLKESKSKIDIKSFPSLIKLEVSQLS